MESNQDNRKINQLCKSYTHVNKLKSLKLIQSSPFCHKIWQRKENLAYKERELVSTDNIKIKIKRKVMDKRDGIHLDQVSRIVKEKIELTWF